MCVSSAAVRSKAVVLPLSIHCLLFLRLSCWGFEHGLCFVVPYLVSFLILNHLAGEENAGCFTCIAF